MAGDSRVALAAFDWGTGPPRAGGVGLFVEAVGLGEVGAAHRVGAENSAQSQVAHARVAGSSRATVLRIWRSRLRTCRERQSFPTINHSFLPLGDQYKRGFLSHDAQSCISQSGA